MLWHIHLLVSPIGQGTRSSGWSDLLGRNPRVGEGLVQVCHGCVSLSVSVFVLVSVPVTVPVIRRSDFDFFLKIVFDGNVIVAKSSEKNNGEIFF